MLPFKGFYKRNSANILLFAAAVHRLRITIEKDTASEINGHFDNGKSIKFKQCSGEIYYYDTINMENKTTKKQVIDNTFLNTSEIKKSYSHRREIKI